MTFPTTFELPTTDSMTGLVNSYYFRHLLREKLLPEAQSSNEPLSLMLIDLDNFMEANKNYGRQAGDQILLGVAHTLQETMPETALISRYGGDEFGVALPETPLDDAFTLAEEFRRRINALKFEQWPEVSVKCSIGLAAFPANGSNEGELFREADQACYIAKSTGRNKVALPLADSRMVTKTSHYTLPQLERLSQLAKTLKRNEASLLREGLDDLLKKYNDRLGSAPRE
jgi:diguanylate cyclase (GGDEF)-like protein